MTAVLAVAAVWLLVALGITWLARRQTRRHNPRAHIRALPRIDPLTPVWPERTPRKEGWL